MQLTPRYDDPSFLTLSPSLPTGDPQVPLVRQRRRLADAVSALDDEQWAAPSRCEGWSVKDVVAHLVGVNQFWAFAIGGGLAGKPTRLLNTFDPVASPAALVDSTREQSPAQVLAAFVAANEGLAATVEHLTSEEWERIGEAPPGHVPLRALAWHALWDAWVHERDILLPLGLPVIVEDDEVVASLVYCAALSPMFAVSGEDGRDRSGALAVEATDPDVRFVVEVEVGRVRVRELAGEAPPGAARLTGRCTDLLEGLSFRAPLPGDAAVAPEHEWLLGGLAAAFDRIG